MTYSWISTTLYSLTIFDDVKSVTTSEYLHYYHDATFPEDKDLMIGDIQSAMNNNPCAYFDRFSNLKVTR